jgi:flagellar basal-body rod protein FlgB
MAFPHSDAFQDLARIRRAIEAGDLAAAAAATSEIARQPVPNGPALGDYLTALNETLIAARAWRANAQTSLARLRAAAGFRQSSGYPPGCHNFVDSALP